MTTTIDSWPATGGGGLDPGLVAGLIVFVLLVWLVPAYFVARYARRKGYSFWAFLGTSLLLSWALPLLAAAIAEDRSGTCRGGAKRGRLDRLEQLARLRDAGTLSPAEFEAEKARLLG